MGNPVRRGTEGGKKEPTSQCLYWYFNFCQILFFFKLSLGRTVTVKDDLAMAYKSLDIILSRNKVRQTLRMEERHEKKGVKRRRLSSQRWRKRFADEVCFSSLSHLLFAYPFGVPSGSQEGAAGQEDSRSRSLTDSSVQYEAYLSMPDPVPLNETLVIVRLHHGVTST